MNGVGEERGPESERGQRRIFTLWAAIAFGAALGTVFFVFTTEVVWIAIGPALGIVVGAAIAYRHE